MTTRKCIGFVGGVVDVSDGDRVYQPSSSLVALFPRSAFPGFGSGGTAEIPVGGTVLRGTFVFVEYRASGYVGLGRDPGFDAEFSESRSRYRCTVDAGGGRFYDVWMLFDADSMEERTSLKMHTPSVWAMDQDGEGVHRVQMSVARSSRMKAVEGSRSDFRYFYLVDSADGVKGCIVAEEAYEMNGVEASDAASDPDRRLISLGSLQDRTRGVTTTGGTPAKAGFIPQLGKDGMLDESMLPNSYGGLEEELERHVNNTDNPHAVTKDQVGLGNVDNTSDMDKPVSTATMTEIEKISKALLNNSNPTIGEIASVLGWSDQ